MNSSTKPSFSRYFSRRCCLQISAVCFCRFLVPNPMGDASTDVPEDGRLADLSWWARYIASYIFQERLARIYTKSFIVELVQRAMDHHSSGCLPAEKFTTYASWRAG